MKLAGSELVALLVAVSFAAGLNVYATVATLGLLAHVGLLTLPPGLHLLESWYVIAASGALFGIEFFADKIPAFGSSEKPPALQFTNRLHAAGVMVVPAGTHTIRLLPPLNLKPQDAGEGISKIEEVVKSLS